MYSLSKIRTAHSLQLFKIIFKRLDFIQIFAMIALLLTGVMFIYSTGDQLQDLHPSAFTFWKKQLVWIAIGSGAWLFFTLKHYKILSQWSFLIYGLAIFLLIIVLIPGIGIKIYGARRWLPLPGFRLQPSEFAKFAVLIMCAKFMSVKNFDANKLKNIAKLAVIVGLPFILILKEPDLGSSLVLMPLVAALLFVARIKWKYIFIAMISVAILIPLAYCYVLKGYQKKRVDTFLYPDSDLANSGWHQYQAELAVGSGGMYGKGFGQGKQNALGFLSQAHTDFIFSVIAEELGFMGALGIITSLSLLIFSAFRTAILARDEFGRYVATGIGTIIFFHSLVNIGMCVRVMPVTGLPLPLVSYGGSFIVSTMMYLGILQSIYAHRKKINEKTNDDTNYVTSKMSGQTTIFRKTSLIKNSTNSWKY